MNIAKYIIVVAISIAVAFIFSCSEGSNGASGADGINGANGIDGTDCAIEATSGEEIASGEYKITCDGVAIG
ncbi:MAG: hypothetical protein FWC26_02945, partial [Fibromonadales bacterium]|nr:hypothetical protein [Fibromonadales bacterium]